MFKLDVALIPTFSSTSIRKPDKRSVGILHESLPPPAWGSTMAWGMFWETNATESFALSRPSFIAHAKITYFAAPFPFLWHWKNASFAESRPF